MKQIKTADIKLPQWHPQWEAGQWSSQRTSGAPQRHGTGGDDMRSCWRVPWAPSTWPWQPPARGAHEAPETSWSGKPWSWPVSSSPHLGATTPSSSPSTSRHLVPSSQKPIIPLTPPQLTFRKKSFEEKKFNYLCKCFVVAAAEQVMGLFWVVPIGLTQLLQNRLGSVW